MSYHERNKCVACECLAFKGVVILDSFLCQNCEAEVVNMSVGDARYEFLIERLKQNWRDFLVPKTGG